MLAIASARHVAPSARPASAVAALSVYECERDTPRVAIPRPEMQIVVRFGSMAKGGLDGHAFGMRDKVHRKLLRRGHRVVAARLELGASIALLGVPPATLAGRVIPLEDLWGDVAARELFDRLAAARDGQAAAVVLERAIDERMASARARDPHARLAIGAAERLAHANVQAVADELGVSERHLRRVFRETVGVSPKTFAKLTRFRRALSVADREADAGWASIAAEAGYYDQAHLIAEFRAIAGVTPRALLAELRAAPPLR